MTVANFMGSIFRAILTIPGRAKCSILIAADSVLLIGALWLSFSLRLDNWYWPRGGVNNPIVLLVLFAPVFAVPVFAHFGLYRAIIRYLGMTAAWSIVKAVMIYAALWGLVAFLSGVQGVPRSVVPINAMVAVLAVGGSRMFARWLLRKIEDSVRITQVRYGSGANAVVAHQTRVVIFGAGAAGRQFGVPPGYLNPGPGATAEQHYYCCRARRHAPPRQKAPSFLDRRRVKTPRRAAWKAALAPHESRRRRGRLSHE